VLTLVFTDLADSTALKSRHGDAAMDSLLTRHRDHVTRLAAECSGRVIDWAGDGCFLTFEISSAGVIFALRLQQVQAEEPDLPGVRVGIHLGEVTETPGAGGGPPRVGGLAVDLAARISGLAKPGQVLMSSAVYNSARQRLGVEAFGQPVLWQTHGTYALKGFDEPLDIGEAALEGLAPLEAPTSGDKAKLIRRAKHPASRTKQVPFRAKPPAKLLLLVLGAVVVLALLGVVAYFAGRSKTSTPALDSGPITSLAVLPLDNLMNDPKQDYFADGMTEAVTGELSKIRALKVVSRTSVMQYKDTVKTAPVIAGELGVQGLIEGSVMRDGNKVRITVQLIDARSDAHLWAKTYDGTLENVFELHSTVALAIANEVRAVVTPDEHARIARDVPVDPEAYEYYLHAGTAFDNAIYDAALAQLDQALRIAPDFAEAWSAKASTMSFALVYFSGDKADYIREASEAVTRALRLAPDDTYAHSASSLFELMVELDWQKAASEAARSVELNPNSPEAHYARASVAIMAGDFPTAREALFKMIELDPHSTFNRAAAAIHLSNLGDQTESLRILDAVLAEYPNYPLGIYFRSYALSRMGRHDEAVAAATRYDELAGGIGESRLNLAAFLGFAGRIGEARSIAEPFLSGRAREPAAAREIARYRISIGETELALDSMEKEMDPPDFLTLLALRVNPFVPGTTAAAYVPLLESPRFWKLVDKLNFPPFPPGHPGYEPQQRWLAKKKAAADANAPITKIAVLPFKNISGDPQQEFFVDGMTEALISELAKIKSIKVISRTSAMHYKDTDKTLPEIARELGVDGLVEGSAMKADNQVRITAQLIRAATDEHLWAESYTETLENVLKVQAQVALAITTEIKAAVTPDERGRVNAAKTVNIAAYDAYVQGRSFWNSRSPEGLRRAHELFTQSLDIDPNFALGHAGLADTYYTQAEYDLTPSEEAYRLGRAEAEKALALDPNAGEAYATLGMIMLAQTWDWAGSEKMSLKGIELSPNYATGHHWYGLHLFAAGHRSEGVEELRLAHQLDPNAPVIGAMFAELLGATGHTQESFDLADRLVRQYPSNWRVQAAMASLLFRAGKYEDALAAVERMVAAEGNRTANVAYKAMALAKLGRTAEARKIMEDETSGNGFSKLQSFFVARTYAVLGDRDRAIEWLTNAVDSHDVFAWRTRIFTEFEAMDDDPRYQALLRRMNFPD
jgi:TolB-like protein/tetratricopeptide (TPR) repeat protein/class 3 adenylate cyclase